MKFTDKTLNWTNEPAKYSINNNEIIITTSPHTDLWQKTYYKFINDNRYARVYQYESKQ